MKYQTTFVNIVILCSIFLLLGNSGYSAVLPVGDGDGSNKETIDWSPDIKLKWSDFKASKKPMRGFAVAASTCGFGYEGMISKYKVSIKVYVRFYRNESWHNEQFDYPDVLAHEQLHFDICELFGRLLYKEVVRLRSRGQLTENSLEIVYDDLIEQYDQFQDRYDKETDHSTIASKQQEWNTKIRLELQRLSDYAYYDEF